MMLAVFECTCMSGIIRCLLVIIFGLCIICTCKKKSSVINKAIRSGMPYVCVRMCICGVGVSLNC